MGPRFDGSTVTVTGAGLRHLHVRTRTGYLMPTRQDDDDRPRGKGHRQAMSWTSRLAGWTAYAFLLVGLLALGYAAYLVVDAKAYQAIEGRRFEQARLVSRVVPARRRRKSAPR